MNGIVVVIVVEMKFLVEIPLQIHLVEFAEGLA